VISETDIYRLQAHAIAADDQQLRYLTYTALGHDNKIAMIPTTLDEKLRAIQGCTDQLEMMQTMGVELLTTYAESIDDLIIKSIWPALPHHLSHG
jgi:hypothetical protein